MNNREKLERIEEILRRGVEVEGRATDLGTSAMSMAVTLDAIAKVLDQ